LIGGRKGHISSFDWKSGKIECELHLRETAKDVTWLHNETMFAVAQKKYTYIYDKTGLELHCLKEHIEANKLEFLPYHFLLVSVVNKYIIIGKCWVLEVSGCIDRQIDS
jgi:U3 small nucleolar RNA-associated protein 7